MNHPGDDALLALSLGELGDADLARVSAHLGACPACCLRIDQLGADDRLLARLRDGASTREAVLVGPTERRSAVRALRQLQEAGAAARAPRAPAAPPTQIGDYDILGEVGRGGMGVVYQARHRALHRPAALKMVLAGEFASPTEQLRFRLEAELAARVRHPNIVQVYEVGSHDGRPFLALEWVEGGSLAARLAGTPPEPPGDAAALVETLARAIHVAHAAGVVHRDLKSANILLTADGTPKITDFGLARPLEGTDALTRSGVLVGTPGYMAPEQATGSRALVGPATDVYALGVVLYELLTGRLPFRGDGTLELLRAVASDDPPRPRRLRPGLPRDLEAVALHCLEKEPARRYPSALALADDIARFRAGKPVTARPAGTAARFARACRRRPLVALLVGLLAATGVAGLGGVTWQWREATASARRADAEKQAALRQAYRASLAAASAALTNHDVADAARHLLAAPDALRGWEWKHLSSRLDDSSAVIPLPAGAGSFLLPAADRLRVGVRTAGGLRVTDLDGSNPVTVPTGTGHHVHVVATRRGLQVTSWVGRAGFDLTDEAGVLLCHVATPGMTDDMQPDVYMSPDGGRLACRTDGDGTRLTVFDAANGRPVAVCRGHEAAIWAAAFSPDGSHLATGSEDRTVRLWNAATGALVATFRGHAGKIISVAFSPDGSRLATAATDGTVRQWDPATGREAEPAYDRHAAEVYTAVYSPDGEWVASAGDDRTVRVWRARGREDAAALHGHTGLVLEVAFAPDGRGLASLSQLSAKVGPGDDTVRVWDVTPGAAPPVLRGHGRTIYPVAFSPDGRWLASGSWDGTVRLWDAATGESCATLTHPSFVFGLAFGPDGSWLVTGCLGEERLRVWDVATARVIREIDLPGRSFHSLALSPDGTRVVATERWGPPVRYRTTVCDTSTGRVLGSLDLGVLAASPDGRWLAALDVEEKTVLLLDARTHEVAARFVGHDNTVLKGAFSPDGRLLATAGRDRTIRLWELDPLPPPAGLESGTGCRVLHGLTDQVYALAFHPDGTRLASAGRDGAVWLWDPARGEDVVRLPGHRSFIWSLAFDPGGATLASGSGDGTVRLWDTAPVRTRSQARFAAAALRPEAERLIDALRSRTTDPAEVVSALRGDRALTEPLRQAALRAALRRAQPPVAAPKTPPNR